MRVELAIQGARKWEIKDKITSPLEYRLMKAADEDHIIMCV